MIAVVVAGVLIGREMRARLEPSRVLALLGFWEIAAFGINVVLFLLVGMQLRSDLLLREAWPIALAVVALHAGRAVAVYGCFGVLRLLGDRRAVALAARDGVRQHQGRAVDGRGAGAARGRCRTAIA